MEFIYKNEKSKTRDIFDKLISPVAAGYLITFSLFDELIFNVIAAWFFGFFVTMPLLRSMNIFSRDEVLEESETTRGTEIVTAREIKKQIKEKGLKTAARIGDIPIPIDVENRSFLFCGAPGSGKSQAFLQVLESVRDRQMTAIVADLGGEFAMRFYRPGQDIIINVFDERSVDWSPFAEMRDVYDAASIAQSIVPDAAGEAQQFHNYARGVIEVIMERLFETDKASNGALCYYALVASTEELATLCAESAASPNFEKGNERLLGSIRTVLTTCIKPYSYLNPQAGKNAFSILDHVEAGKDSWLFLTFKEKQFSAMKPLIAAQIDVAASTVKSMTAALDRRIWFVLDEFATLGAISSMEPLLSKGRKYGVSAILGLQSIAQVQHTFGDKVSQVILSCIGNWLILRTPDAETAEYMSKFLGDEERCRVVDSGGDNEAGRAKNWSEQFVRQRALMPSEISQLEDLDAVLKLKGSFQPARTKIEVVALPRNSEAFIDVVNTRSRRITKPESLGTDVDVSNETPIEKASSINILDLS
jgi:hypothetical protein